MSVSVERKNLVAYNLTVAQAHTYFVTGQAGADPVWVHNECEWAQLPRGSRKISEKGQSGEELYETPDGKVVFFDEVTQKLRHRYSGDLKTVPKDDAQADALGSKLGGKSRVRYETDPNNREFDVVSDEYIGQAKPASLSYNKEFRDQAKSTFKAASETGKKVYYQFEGTPRPEVVSKLQEYSRRYGVELVLDYESLL